MERGRERGSPPPLLFGPQSQSQEDGAEEDREGEGGRHARKLKE